MFLFFLRNGSILYNLKDKKTTHACAKELLCRQPIIPLDNRKDMKTTHKYAKETNMLLSEV